MSDIAVAALLAGTVLLASTISVEIGLSVALIELLAGVVVGNAFHLDVPSWLSFVGSFAGILLTFQAGAEVDVVQFRSEWRASLSIGLGSFFAPCVTVALLAYYGLDWSRRQAEIGGLALSTTSLAVVYAVLVETGLNRELVGKRLMSATFVTDIATVAGLTILFVKPTLWIIPFVLASLVLIVALPRLATGFFARYGNRVIEPEIKLVFAALFVLMWLGSRANSQAALPAFVLGLVMSSFYASHRAEQNRMRVVSFAFLNYVSLRAQRAHHRPDAILASDLRRRLVGDRPHSDRPTLLPAAAGGASGSDCARAACSRARELARARRRAVSARRAVHRHRRTPERSRR